VIGRLIPKVETAKLCGSIVTMLNTENIEDFIQEYKNSDVDICVKFRSCIFTIIDLLKCVFRSNFNNLCLISSLKISKLTKIHYNRYTFYYNGIKFDIFASDDPYKTIAKFHLSCVRAFYGTEFGFYVTPSFIKTAINGGICYDSNLNPKINNKNLKSIYKYLRRGSSFNLSSDYMRMLEKFLHEKGYNNYKILPTK